MSPSALTLERLALWGFSACTVERYIAPIQKRKDAFGFGDILACKSSGANKGCWLIQATSASNHSARMKKAKSIAELRAWLESGGRFAVVSWGKNGMRWEEVKS